jgi:hypothetical protein
MSTMQRNIIISIGVIVPTLACGYAIGRLTTEPTVVTIQAATPIVDSCPDKNALIELDTELFASYAEFNKKVVGILDYAYMRPEGDRFDGTGIYLTNQALNWFYRNNSDLLKQRKTLLQN